MLQGSGCEVTLPKMQPKVAIHDRTLPDNILLPGDNHNLAAPTPATTKEKSLAYKIVYMVPLKEFIWVNQNLVCSELHAGKPYRTILGEPLGPENIGALGSIKEGHWVRKWRAIVSNCGL